MASITHYVTYHRDRPAERFASLRAKKLQTEIEARLVSGDAQIAPFGDSEHGQPDQGWQEDRAGWVMACAEANRIFVEGDPCTLVILHSAGIGYGDPFLPPPAQLKLHPGIRVVVGDPRAPAQTCSLNEAIEQRRRWAAEVVAADTGAAPVTLKGKAQGDLQFINNPIQRVTRAYFCNWSGEPLFVRWQRRERKGPGAPFLIQGDLWTDLEIQPGTASYLATFIQGEYRGGVKHWRFRTGSKRATRGGGVLIGSERLRAGYRSVAWNDWEPQPLSASDFRWMSAPCLSTPRLTLRNWRRGDAGLFDQHCNTSEVMEWLGGVQSARESRSDAAYFARLGKTGPTFWVMERRSDEEFLGFCGVLVVDEVESPVRGELEIGWRLRADCQRKGYALEAAAETLRFVFDELNAPEVVARIAQGNCASRALADALRMTANPARTHTPDRESEPLLVYEISRGTYSALRPKYDQPS